MVKATRKQKGAGASGSSTAYGINLAYSDMNLTTDALAAKINEEYPTQGEKDTIFTLNVSGNNLYEMPNIVMQNLNSLECSNNKLRVISSAGEIPELRSITDLYPYLQSLYCDNNELT
jgi:hypothetical protein